MTLDYAAVLADLQGRRDELDVAIRAIAPFIPQRRVEAPKEKPADKVPRSKVATGPKCSKCQASGHNARTCPGVDGVKVEGLYRRCGDCAQRTPAKGACNHCGAKDAA